MSNLKNDKKLHLFLLLGLIIVFGWSLIGCFDFLTWFLDALPVVVGVIILVAVYRRFRFTNFTYILISLYAVILLIGARYTYTCVPLFTWARDTFSLSRNYYDRFGHLAQGFVPAVIAREVLLRKSPLRRGGWLISVVICFCLAVSAFYEIFEYFIVLVGGTDMLAFLAMQGDPWDAQKDMLLCLVGSVLSLFALSKSHDKALQKLKQDPKTDLTTCPPN